MSDQVAGDILGLTAQIVSAHLSKNQISTDALPSLIQSVYRSLSTAGEVEAAEPAQTPAVPIKKSVLPDYIVCLEDGKKLKMLKRHLQTRRTFRWPQQVRASSARGTEIAKRQVKLRLGNSSCSTQTTRVRVVSRQFACFRPRSHP
jgi:hypothetical protein